MDSARHRVLPPHSKLTYEDYLQLPDDGRRYEILDGDLAVTPAPTTVHQHVSLALAHLLYGYVTAQHLGRVFTAPVDVILSKYTIAQPDLVYVASSRESIVKERGIEGPPDLVVEILSRSTAQRDRTTKANLYARHGVAHYWLIEPKERTLETYERGKRRYRRTGRFTAHETVCCNPFPELSIRLSALWPPARAK